MANLDGVARDDQPGERVSAASSLLISSRSGAATASGTAWSSTGLLVPSRVIGIVVTPGSGEGRARVVAQRLRRLLRRRGVPSATRTFDDLASLTAWAGQSGPEYAALVSIGGDATQSAAAIYARRHAIPFLPVPSGFGNLFAGFFGHPSSPRQVLQLLDRGAVRRVDVGVAGDELFLVHRRYGFLDDVQEQVEAGRKQPKGRLARLAAYYRTAVLAIGRTALTPLHVEVDGVVVAEDAVLVTVANVETYRGFLNLTPAASPIDGRFDIF